MAGISKFAGITVIALALVAVAPPSIAITALIGAVPLILAALAIVFFGIETRKRSLEEITEEQLSHIVIADDSTLV
jgi:putative MFS transporter